MKRFTIFAALLLITLPAAAATQQAVDPAHQDALAQLIIALCRYVEANAHNYAGKFLALFPVIGAPAGVILAFSRSAPGLWLVNAVWSYLKTLGGSKEAK
jgi:hypothetical protein